MPSRSKRRSSAPIFTCESLRPYALGSSAGRFTEYDHVVEAVPPQNLVGGET